MKSKSQTPPQTPPLSLAIACQGGGSHCAFGAGVLMEVLTRLDADHCIERGGKRYRICSLSGTSGGAINALMAWYGLTRPNGLQAGIAALDGFWQDNAAHEFWDAIANLNTVNTVRLRGILPQIETAPDLFSDWAQQRLRTMLEKHIPFAELETGSNQPTSPSLLIGAANVLDGQFTVFGSHPGFVPKVEHLLASTAVPELFKAVQIDKNFYWDGLLSQNPPVRDFLHGENKDNKPDAIWVIRINPRMRQCVPHNLVGIMDRRNEMSGSLSLEQEYFFIERVNRWIDTGQLTGPYKKVSCEEMELEAHKLDGEALDYASKLDRRPDFLSALIEHGRDVATRFLNLA